MNAMFGPESKNRWTALVRGIQAGDSASDDEFARIFYPRVMALASYHLRDIDAALEITQDTLLNVLRAVRERRLRDDDKLSAFVAGTARNLVKNFFQKKAENPPMVSLGPEEESILAPYQVHYPSAEEGREKRSAVRAALKVLRPMDQRILFLTLSEGLNPREIAVELGMKPEVIRNRKSRALKVIRRKMKKLI